MDCQTVIEKLCQDLPPNWEVHIKMERYAGWTVAVHQETGFELAPRYTDDTLEEQILHFPEQIEEYEENLK